MNIYQWGKQWGIAPDALADLVRQMGTTGAYATPGKGGEGEASESRVQSLVRLEGAQKDVWLWRNNVGALLDVRGVPVRYGLANESKEQNTRIKSGDLIGIRKMVITLPMVGQTIGVFVSREIKKGGWVYTGQGREAAQMAWLTHVLSLGGDAAFAPGVGTL